MTIACVFMEVSSSDCNFENLDNCKVLGFSCNIFFGWNGFIGPIQCKTYGLKDGVVFFGVIVLGNKQVMMWSVAKKGRVRHLGFVSFFNKNWMEFLSIKLNVLIPCVYLFICLFVSGIWGLSNICGKSTSVWYCYWWTQCFPHKIQKDAVWKCKCWLNIH